MKTNKRTSSAVLVLAAIGLGAGTVIAQTAPGTGSSSGATSGSGAPAASPTPQPGPAMPRQMEPTLPGKPAPVDPKLTQPLPGQQGTIPEQMQPPTAGTTQTPGGLSPDQIRRAQEALKSKGMNPGTSGANDPTTQQAVRDFQKANNLPVTGVLDPNTLDKLGVSGNGTSTAPKTQGSTAPQKNRVVP
jgi:peptidoglycan hydrolase-like protein with peptidoglycan-binding domain